MTDTPDLCVGHINHAARVTIYEDGCIAAAFTAIGNETAGRPTECEEIDFAFDRTFLFVITSRDDLPLFAGVVNEP